VSASGFPISLVTLAQVDYQLERQQVGASKNMPRASIAKSADELLDAFQMQRQCVARTQTDLCQHSGKLHDFAAQAT
jgi:hypothetical protein